MLAEIIKAIEERKLLSITYKGSSRTIEPHTYGCSKKGVNALCAWQVDGTSGSGYRLFLEPQIQRVSSMSDHFEGPRPDYRSGDPQFTAIYAEL